LGIWERVNPNQVSGTFTNRNLYSAYVTITGPMAILVWWLREVPGMRHLPVPPRVAAMSLTAALVAIAMMATGSRQGAIAGLVALLVAGYLWLYRDMEPGALRRWAAAGVAGLVVLVLLWYGPALVLQRFTEIGLDTNRWDVWGLMLTELPTVHWLTGSGLGSFEMVFRTVQTAELAARYSHAHNDLLEWWLETGVVGLAILALIATALARRAALTRLRAPVYAGLAAAAVVGLVDFSWHMPGTQLVLACYLGLALRPVQA
jgi:O-antigen ligase